MRTIAQTRILLAALRDRRGVSAAEYAILAVGVVVVVAAGVTLLGDPTNGAFARAGSQLTTGISNMASTVTR